MHSISSNMPFPSLFEVLRVLAFFIHVAYNFYSNAPIDADDYVEPDVDICVDMHANVDGALERMRIMMPRRAAPQQGPRSVLCTE